MFAHRNNTPDAAEGQRLCDFSVNCSLLSFCKINQERMRMTSNLNNFMKRDRCIEGRGRAGKKKESSLRICLISRATLSTSQLVRCNPREMRLQNASKQIDGYSAENKISIGTNASEYRARTSCPACKTCRTP